MDGLVPQQKKKKLRPRRRGEREREAHTHTEGRRDSLGEKAARGSACFLSRIRLRLCVGGGGGTTMRRRKDVCSFWKDF